ACEAGDIAEVAGDHRQHAGTEAGYEASGSGHRDRQHQRSGQRGGLEGLSDLGDHSASTRSIIARSVEGSRAPEIRAATRPSRSSTKVEGTALGATCPRRAY